MYKLTDFEWLLIEPLFEQIKLNRGGNAHTCWREVMNGILFVLLTKASWGSIPKEEGFAAKSVAQRWYKKWKETGFLSVVLDKLKEAGKLRETPSFPRNRNRLSKAEVIHPFEASFEPVHS